MLQAVVTSQHQEAMTHHSSHPQDEDKDETPTETGEVVVNGTKIVFEIKTAEPGTRAFALFGRMQDTTSSRDFLPKLDQLKVAAQSPSLLPLTLVASMRRS